MSDALPCVEGHFCGSSASRSVLGATPDSRED